jgi:hypothetical protein
MKEFYCKENVRKCENVKIFSYFINNICKNIQLYVKILRNFMASFAAFGKYVTLAIEPRFRHCDVGLISDSQKGTLPDHSFTGSVLAAGIHLSNLNSNCTFVESFFSAACDKGVSSLYLTLASTVSFPWVFRP